MQKAAKKKANQGKQETDGEELKLPLPPPDINYFIRLLFCQSMMSIQSEAKEGNKYNRLDFVEFIEMLCRAPMLFEREK